MIAHVTARLSELERRFEQLRLRLAAIEDLLAQLQQMVRTNRPPGITNDSELRLAQNPSSIASGASGSVTYYKLGSVSALTSPTETATAYNPHPSASVPSSSTCIVGTVGGVRVVLGWYC